MLYKALRVILYPFVRFLLPVFSSKARSRLKLELAYVNNSDVDIIFHVSSEGELEQCFPLLIDYLKESKVLLLFTSNSVLKKALELKYQEKNLHIEVKRVLTYFPFFKKGIYKYKNVKAFFMVRYDFFPELIDFSYKHNSILLNASLIGKDRIKGFVKFFLKRALLSFDKIVYASESEVERFKALGVSRPYYSLDLRSLRIINRKDCAQSKLNATFKSFFNYRDLSFNKVVVLGSYWSSEFKYLESAIKKSLSTHDLLFIAPHSLGTCLNIAQEFTESGIKSIIVDSSTDLSEVYQMAKANKMAIIINVQGILCELYSVCDHAYIAGGWHKSIHSVLEPFLMASNSFISCGPNILRSTEFELASIIDNKRISSFNRIDQFEFMNEDHRPQSYELAQKYLELKEFIL